MVEGVTVEIERRETNFAEFMSRAAEQWPDRPLLVEHDKRSTFAEVQGRVVAFAGAYRTCGVRPGDRVCILLPRGDAAIAAFFGALAVGAIGCIVNEGYRSRQIRVVLADTGAKVIVASDELWEPLREDPPSRVLRLDPSSIPEPENHHSLGHSHSVAAQITYTSGSTGGPKGVLASHANLWAGATVVPNYLGLTPDDRIASLLPFSTVYGFSQLTCAIATGATLVIERSTLARDIFAGLDRERVSVVAGVPSTWMQLIQGGMQETPLRSLRIATCAGGRLAPEIVRTLRQVQTHAEVFLMYGLTEVFRSAYLRPHEVDVHPDSMGRAVPGAEIFVLRDDGTPCDAGEVGELVHRGPTVAMGYWNDSDLTARVFRTLPIFGAGEGNSERVVYSGDLVKRDEHGLLYFVGRRDRMIKTLGYRVSPEEVTDVLVASKLTREAAVTSEPDPLRGERIVAHVSLRDGASLVDVRRFCGVELPRYMQPTRYELYDTLPRNPAGKVDMLALRETVGTG